MFTEYDGYWELLESLGQQNMSDNEKRMWLLDHMFLKDKNAQWTAMFLMLGTQTLSQTRATYKETTDAIAAYQTKLDLAEANANNQNVTVVVAKADKKKKEEDFEWYKAFYTDHQKGKGGGGKNASRGNGKGRGRGKGSGKGAFACRCPVVSRG